MAAKACGAKSRGFCGRNTRLFYLLLGITAYYRRLIGHSQQTRDPRPAAGTRRAGALERKR